MDLNTIKALPKKWVALPKEEWSKFKNKSKEERRWTWKTKKITKLSVISLKSLLP